MAKALKESTFTGQDIVTIAKTRIGERYVLGQSVPKNNPDWHGPWDCAEFVAWCIYQITGKLYGCNNNDANPAKADAYTGYFKNDVLKIGKKITVQQAASTKGALILRYPAPAGHIVISDGTGSTIEAMGAAWGVRMGSLDNRRWDTGILIPWIRYEQLHAGVVQKPGIIYRYKTPVMQSPKIGEIQAALTARGYNTYGIDDKYGINTAMAVKTFQQNIGLVVDGEVGGQTASALNIIL